MNDLVIRPALESDVPALNALYNHYVAETAVTFDVQPSSLDQRLAWFRQFAKTGRYRLLVAQIKGQFAGYTGSLQFKVKEAYQTSVETTIYVDPGFQGRSVGRSLYDALFAELATEEVHRAYGGITLPNDASVSLHKRAGFQHIGTWNEVGFKHGKYQDVAWYERQVEGR
jgi:phosphinothricin acetyltransferase